MVLLNQFLEPIEKADPDGAQEKQVYDSGSWMFHIILFQMQMNLTQTGDPFQEQIPIGCWLVHLSYMAKLNYKSDLKY